MRALITGATGFIGSHLTERLAASEHEVHVLVQQSSDPRAVAALCPVVKLHVTDGSFADLKAIIRSAAPEIVFHAASRFLSEHQPEDVAALVQGNILFPCQLVEAMIRNGVHRLVNCNTSWHGNRILPCTRAKSIVPFAFMPRQNKPSPTCFGITSRRWGCRSSI